MSIFSRAARVRRQTEARLAEHHTQKKDFYVLITIASAIACIGLALNNVSIIIGAMVVAPLITPVFGFSLSLIVLNMMRGLRSLWMLFLGTILALAISVIVGYLMVIIEGPLIALNSEIISRTEPNLLFFLTALLSGMAGAYAYAKPQVLASIAGIAISVAVIPPLAVSGLAIVFQDPAMFNASFLLYLLNLAGISFGAIIMFVSLGFGKDK